MREADVLDHIWARPPYREIRWIERRDDAIVDGGVIRHCLGTMRFYTACGLVLRQAPFPDGPVLDDMFWYPKNGLSTSFACPRGYQNMVYHCYVAPDGTAEVTYSRSTRWPMAPVTRWWTDDDWYARFCPDVCARACTTRR